VTRGEADTPSSMAVRTLAASSTLLAVNDSIDPGLTAGILEALPVRTLLVDRELRVVHANAAARSLLGARPGAAMGVALGCVEGAALVCGQGARCAGCAVRCVAERAIAGEPGRARGFVLRAGGGGLPADLHLLVSAAPFAYAAAPHALLAIEDVDEILADPGVIQVCGGCGRVEDDGEWHELHRYMEDRLGLEVAGELCADCEPKARAR